MEGKGRRPRVLLVTMLSAVIAFCAFGCSSDEPSATPEPEAKPDPAVALSIQAASSLTDALTEISDQYSADNRNVTIEINFDSSGTLQEQISQGAPADLFISAANKNMDALEEDGLLLEGTRTNLLGNTLALIVPADSSLAVSSLVDLAGSGVKVVALGDAESVPAGKYAAQALKAAGVADAVNDKAVLGKDVRAVLTYVETKDADAGIVYQTDALVSDKVKIAAEIPSDTYDAIVYPAAVIGASENVDAAKAFLEYLSSPAAAKVWEKYGFTAE